MESTWKKANLKVGKRNTELRVVGFAQKQVPETLFLGLFL